MVSIIVPVWNHLYDVTVPFLNDILKTKGDFELIIVNNGSVDETAWYFRNEVKDKRVKLVNSPVNLGFGGGNNLGFAKAKGEYICFISNDVMIKDPNWLRTLIDEFKKKPGLLGDMYIDFNTLTSYKNIPTPYIGGYLMFASRDLFNDIKEGREVFDEGFGKAYFEDVDLSVRAAFKGYELREVKSGVEHLGSKSSDQINIARVTKSAQRYFRNKMTYHWLKKNNKKRVVFYFESSYEFDDSSYEGKGVGGAEASLILLARQFAKAGWQTEVYNATVKGGVFHGVEYQNIAYFNPTDYCDVFILFRVPYRYLPIVNAKLKIFWSCDQYTSGDWGLDILPYVDRVVCISEYHAGTLRFKYGKLPDKIRVIDLGVVKEDYDKEVEKIPGKMIFCSVPRRGLEHLARLFPKIKARVPHASLVITSDYRLWGVDFTDTEGFTVLFPPDWDVSYLSKVDRKILVQHQLGSEVMAYPCTYEECFCIAAMECIAAGAIPVTTAIGAMPTTVGDSGHLIGIYPDDPSYDKEFVDEIVKLLTDKDYASIIRKRGRERALKLYSWDHVYTYWADLIKDSLRGGEKIVKCKVCKKTVKSAYALSKHMAKLHVEELDEILEGKPTGVVIGGTYVLRTTQPVECQINGVKFSSLKGEEHYEMEVPNVYLAAVVENVRNSYGPDTIII